MKLSLNLFLLFFCQLVYSQDIIGSWKINQVIAEKTKNPQEYVLYKIDTSNKYYSTYGTKIVFNRNGTFHCSYSAPCGNDCFPSSSGTFKMTDDKHVSFYVKKFSQVGDCEHKDLKLNLNLGLYYLAINSANIKLIKSNGYLLQDSLNQKYSSMIDTCMKKISYNFQLNKKTTLKGNKERVDEYIKKFTTVKDYSIVYMKVADNYLVNLIKNKELKEDYFYVLTDFTNRYDYKVGFYKPKK